VTDPNHNIIIKPYWLLGVLDGEGWKCFSIQKDVKSLSVTFSFIFTQSLDQKPGMVSIQTFLNNNNLEPNYLDSSESKVKLIVQINNIYKPKH
jgi:hypothetical protein